MNPAKTSILGILGYLQDTSFDMCMASLVIIQSLANHILAHFETCFIFVKSQKDPTLIKNVIYFKKTYKFTSSFSSFPICTTSK